MKTIPGTDDSYAATADGQIVRLKAVAGNCKTGERITSRVDRYGYMRVNLSIRGKVKTVSVHRLVALAFLGEPTGKQINHKDGDKANNRPDNLEWCEAKHNLDHALRTRLRINPSGERNGSSKLTAKQVRFIRAKQGTISQNLLAKRFGVSQSLVSRIQRGKLWNGILAPEIS